MSKVEHVKYEKIDRAQFAKNSRNFIGKNLKIKGRIYKIQEFATDTAILLNVSHLTREVFIITYPGNTPFLRGDKIKVYGKFNGNMHDNLPILEAHKIVNVYHSNQRVGEKKSLKY